MTAKRRTTWWHGLVQIVIAVVLVMAVARWGATWFENRADGVAEELQRRQVP